MGFGLHLHRRIVGLNSAKNSPVDLLTTQAQQVAKENIIYSPWGSWFTTIKTPLKLAQKVVFSLFHWHSSSAIGSLSYSPAGSPPFTTSVVAISSVSSTDRLPSSSVSLAADLRHLSSWFFCCKNDFQKYCHSDFLVYVKCHDTQGGLARSRLLTAQFFLKCLEFKRWLRLEKNSDSNFNRIFGFLMFQTIGKV